MHLEQFMYKYVATFNYVHSHVLYNLGIVKTLLHTYYKYIPTTIELEWQLSS